MYSAYTLVWIQCAVQCIFPKMYSTSPPQHILVFKYPSRDWVKMYSAYTLNCIQCAITMLFLEMFRTYYKYSLNN